MNENLYGGDVQCEMEISAAHWLPFHKGKCKHLHGHNYRFVVIVSGYFSPTDPEGAFIIDFADLKDAMVEVIMPMDHALLSHLSPEELKKTTEIASDAFALLGVTKVVAFGGWTTAENLALYVASEIEAKIRSSDIIGVVVECWETTKCCARMSVPSLGDSSFEGEAQ